MPKIIRDREQGTVSPVIGVGEVGDRRLSEPPTDDPYDVVTDEVVQDAEVVRFTALQASDDGLVGGGGRARALTNSFHTALEMHALPPVPVGDFTAFGSSICRSRTGGADGAGSRGGGEGYSPLFGKVTFCRLHGVGVHANGSLLLPSWMASPGTLASLRLCGLPPLTFAPKGVSYPPLSRSLYGSTTRDLYVAPAPVREHLPHFVSDMAVALAAPAAFPRLPSWKGDVSCVSHVEAAGGLVAEEGAACSFGGKSGGEPLRLVVAVKDQLLGGFLVLRFDVSGFARQKAAVADLDVLVGAHGAGLTNGIFLPGGFGELLEVSPWGMVAPPYGALSAAVGVGHALHFALPDVAGYTSCLRRTAMRLVGAAGTG
eukprot:contig_13395_g3203